MRVDLWFGLRSTKKAIGFNRLLKNVYKKVKKKIFVLLIFLETS